MSKAFFVPVIGLLAVGIFLISAVSWVISLESSRTSSKADNSREVATEIQNPAVGYAPYTAELLENSPATTKVLFFTAEGCASCNVLEADITANSDAIPADWLILSVDYDTAQSLREEYAVTSSHTLIYLNAENQSTAKWSALLSLEDLLQVG